MLVALLLAPARPGQLLLRSEENLTLGALAWSSVTLGASHDSDVEDLPTSRHLVLRANASFDALLFTNSSKGAQDYTDFLLGRQLIPCQPCLPLVSAQGLNDSLCLQDCGLLNLTTQLPGNSSFEQVLVVVRNQRPQAL
jgi:hypothetical protein